MIKRPYVRYMEIYTDPHTEIHTERETSTQNWMKSYEMFGMNEKQW